MPRRHDHTERGGTLGAILSPTRHEGETPNYYVAELMQGVAAETKRAGFELQVAMWDGALPEMAHARNLRGLLFLGGNFAPEVLRTLRRPIVLVGTFFPQVACDAILADNHRGAYLATRHLLELGCRRLGLVNGPGHATTSDSKWLGYRDALHEWGQEVDPAIVAAADFLPAEGYDAARALLGGPQRPDGLFVADDAIALGVLQAASDLGLRVPRDLAVVGYGDSPMAAMLRPPLTSVRVFQRRMARLATHRLLERLTTWSSCTRS
ncbi:MAG: substrate-binding domain-containing protein [Candidatus Dormibacteraceae bacterium]